jgi:hypothetical protein
MSFALKNGSKLLATIVEIQIFMILAEKIIKDFKNTHINIVHENFRPKIKGTTKYRGK